MPSRFVAAALLLLAACSSKYRQSLDPNQLARFHTLSDCLPPLWEKVDRLTQVAELWEMNVSSPPADPAGLTWSELTDGSLDVDFVDPAVTIAMQIRFWSPTGTQQDLDLTGIATLHGATSAAATELRDLFPGSNPFMTGTWTMSGTDIAGNGTLTGILGGTTNGNELEELRTTTATPAGGPPPFGVGIVTLTGAEPCHLTFSTIGLQTDVVQDQHYPIGLLDIAIVGETTVTATITFDNTPIAIIVVNDVPGHFAFDLETLAVDHVTP